MCAVPQKAVDMYTSTAKYDRKTDRIEEKAIHQTIGHCADAAFYSTTYSISGDSTVYFTNF